MQSPELGVCTLATTTNAPQSTASPSQPAQPSIASSASTLHARCLSGASEQVVLGKQPSQHHDIETIHS